jgi:hypothetical protein
VEGEHGHRLLADIAVFGAFAFPWTREAGDTRDVGHALLGLGLAEPDEAAAAGVQGAALGEGADLADLTAFHPHEHQQPLVLEHLVAVGAAPALVFAFQVAGGLFDVLEAVVVAKAAVTGVARDHGDGPGDPEGLRGAGAGLAHGGGEAGGG